MEETMKRGGRGTAAREADCCRACRGEEGREPGHGLEAEGEASRETISRGRVVAFGAAIALWGGGLAVMALKPLASAAAWGRFLPLPFFVASFLVAGFPVLRNAALNLRRGNPLDENFLMSVAALGAFVVGEWEEAGGVMIFYMIGELIQDAAVNRSRGSIAALLSLKPDRARLRRGDDWVETDPAAVPPGSLVLVRPGERVPLDGIVEDGSGSVDASMLTGEALPVSRGVGDELRSGTVSVDGVFQIRTTRTADESQAARIIALVEGAREAKARPERFITAFARWYTPAVVAIAAGLAVLPPLLVPGARFADWGYRALILLVMSCPCALVVSVPLGYFAGLGGLSRRGIMVKGAAHLDALYRAENVAFDKTGTLTRGVFEVIALEPVPGVSDEEKLLGAALWAERESNHPIARAITAYANGHAPGAARAASGLDAAGGAAGVVTRREIAGQGVEISWGGGDASDRILAGTRRFLESRGVFADAAGAGPADGADASAAGTAVYVARGSRYLGRILIGDTLKDGAAEAVASLRTLRIRNTVMLTGDSRGAARETAARVGIDAVRAELLPEDKLAEVEKLARDGVTVFVGDGINDAPVLARSHVGIAMGAGADAAVEAADVVVMTDDPRRVPEAIGRARKIRRIIVENVIFALGAKGIFITLAAMGRANMWLALAADVGVALVAILNAARALR